MIVLTRRRFLSRSARTMALAALWADAFALDPARALAAPRQAHPNIRRSAWHRATPTTTAS